MPPRNRAEVVTVSGMDVNCYATEVRKSRPLLRLYNKKGVLADALKKLANLPIKQQELRRPGSG
jgi:hypothetical protein